MNRIIYYYYTKIIITRIVYNISLFKKEIKKINENNNKINS